MRRHNYVLFLLSFLLLFLVGDLKAQEQQPSVAYEFPVKGKPLFSGTFGELRRDHFHMGLDIKGKVGNPIHAIADGYISRIMISASGYGRALYLKHADGKVSLYGHLSKFNKELEAYVDSVHLAERKNQLDIYLPENRFLYSRGQEIAKMGNEGYSFGPHLHLEVRSDDYDLTYNPLIYFGDEDSQAPRVSRLLVAALDRNNRVLKQSTYKASPSGTNTYTISNGTVSIGGNRVVLGIQCHDRDQGTANKNGIYKIDLNVDGQDVHQLVLDSVAYSRSGFVKLHINQKQLWQSGRQYHNLYNFQADQSASLIQQGNGIIPIDIYTRKEVKISLQDYSGNTTMVKFYLKGNEEQIIPKNSIYNYVLKADEENLIQLDPFKIAFPNGAFLADKKVYAHRTSDVNNSLSYEVLHLGDGQDIVLSDFMVVTDLKDKNPEDRDKYCLVKTSTNDRLLYALPSRLEGDMLITNCSDFGSYALLKDDEPPKIVPLFKGSTWSKKKRLKFSVLDRFWRMKKLKVDCYIDDVWQICKMDAKNNKVILRPMTNIETGSHTLRLEISDPVGNVNIYEQNFILK